MEDTVLFRTEENVGYITLNKSETRNAIDPEIGFKLEKILNNIENDASIRSLVLDGNGASFSAGGDIQMMKKGMSPTAALKFMKDTNRWLLKLLDIPVPVVAAVHGHAVGGGFGLMLAADVIVAGDSTKFGLVFLNLGLVPDLGSMWLLPRIVGPGRAKELIYSRRLFTSKEAYDLGIVQRIVSDDQVKIEAHQWAKNLAKGPYQAMTQMKRIMNQGWNMPLEGVLELEAQAQAICLNSSESREGISAFVEKREPNFLKAQD
jgi:2-(1,2-epoxy-1,2-dihydrophenyl)acetyl-CoA isomerase